MKFRGMLFLAILFLVGRIIAADQVSITFRSAEVMGRIKEDGLIELVVTDKKTNKKQIVKVKSYKSGNTFVDVDAPYDKNSEFILQLRDSKTDAVSPEYFLKIPTIGGRTTTSIVIGVRAIRGLFKERLKLYAIKTCKDCFGLVSDQH